MTTASAEALLQRESDTAAPTPVLKDGEKVHRLKLTRGAVIIARHLLAAQGWAKKQAHIRRGNQLRRKLPKLAIPKDIDDVEDWENELLEPIELVESERKIGAQCVEAFITEGKLGSTDAVDCLCTEFGVVTE